MSKFLVVGNWKMEPQTLDQAGKLYFAVKRAAERLRRVSVVLCPPFVYAGMFAKYSGKQCRVGAQDVFWEFGGAHTGEVSPDMLYNLGVSHVIVGHSEKRALGETDEIVSQKVKAALAAGLSPIVCVGELERDKEGQYLVFLKEEIKKSLSRVTKKNIGHVIVAYEPIWAVGANAKSADTPEGTLEIVIFIKKVLADMFGKKAAMGTQILYGGSVNALNALDFLSRGGVSGLLVGRASLDAKIFKKILKIGDSL